MRKRGGIIIASGRRRSFQQIAMSLCARGELNDCPSVVSYWVFPHRLRPMSSFQPPNELRRWPQRPSDQKGGDGALSTLDTFIQALNLARNTCGIPPTHAAFGAATFLLTAIRVRSLPTLQRRAFGARQFRTRWQMMGITSSPGALALSYAKYCTGG